MFFPDRPLLRAVALLAHRVRGEPRDNRMMDAWPLWVRMAWPGALFDRLYAMPWYGQLLRDWATSGLKPGERVLELGCAWGRLSADLAAGGGVVTAVERSRWAAAVARRRHAGIRVMRADALSGTAPQGAFDHVLAASLLNVVSDPMLLMRRMREHARPGGRIGVLVPDGAFDDAALDVLMRQLAVQGSEAAALRLWHRFAPKMRREAVGLAFAGAGLPQPVCRPLLGGMVLGAEVMRPLQA